MRSCLHIFAKPACLLPACLACLPQIRHLRGKSIGCNERKTVGTKRVLPTSAERKSAGKMQRRRKKCPQSSRNSSSSATGSDGRKSRELCNSCWICIPTMFIIIVGRKNYGASLKAAVLKIVQTSTCLGKKLRRRCVLMIKAAVDGELHKVYLRGVIVAA